MLRNLGGCVIVVTGTGTEVGKTFCAAHMVHSLIGADQHMCAIKPVISGFDYNANDAKELLASMGTEYSRHNLSLISPWRLSAPLAPPIAAVVEGMPLNYEDILGFCLGKVSSEHCLVIETAGGIMSPLAQRRTNLDLIADIKVSAGRSLHVLVCDVSYLGCMSHALTALEAANKVGFGVSILVLNMRINGRDSIADINLLKEHAEVYGTKVMVMQYSESWCCASEIADVIFDLFASIAVAND